MIGFPKPQCLRSFLFLTLIATTLPLQAQKQNRLPQLKVEIDPLLKKEAPQIHAHYKSPLYEAVITTRGDLHVLPVTEMKDDGKKDDGKKEAAEKVSGKALPLEYRLSVTRDIKGSKNKSRNVTEYTVRPEAMEQPEKVVFKGTHEDGVTMECTYTFSEKSIAVEAVCTVPEDLSVPNVFITRWGIPGTHAFTSEQNERERKGILRGYELKTRSKTSTTPYAEERGPKEAFKQATIETHWPGRVLTFDFGEGATFQITDYEKEPRLYRGYSLQPEGDEQKGVTRHLTTLTFE